MSDNTVIDVVETANADTSANDTSLMLKEEFQMPVLSFNKAEMLAKAQEIVAAYKDIAVTEDSYKAAKSDAKKLAGYVKEIDARRKDIKKQVEAPIKQFDADCQEVMKVLKDAQAEIEAQTAQFDQIRLQEQQEKCAEYADKQVQKLGLRAEYASRITMPVKANNLTSSLKSIKEDYDAQIQKLLTEQQDHDTAYAVAESLMDSANQNITQKLTVAKLDYEINNLLTAAVPGDTAGITAAVTNLVNSKAQEILAAEEAVRQQAIADERARAEAEKAAQPDIPMDELAAETNTDAVPTFGAPNPDPVPTFGEAPVPTFGEAPAATFGEVPVPTFGEAPTFGNVEIPSVPVLTPVGSEEGQDANPMSAEYRQFANNIPTFGAGETGEVPSIGANPFGTPTATPDSVIRYRGLVEFVGTVDALGPAIQEMVAIAKKYGIDSKAISCEKL